MCRCVCVCGVYTNETVFPWSNSSGVRLLCPDTCCASWVGWGSFTYFLKTALLRSSSHTIRFFHLKRTIRWFLVIYGIVQPLPHPILGRFHHLEKNLCTIKLSPPLPHPVFPGLISGHLSVCRFKHFLELGSHDLWSSVTCFLPFVERCKVPAC